MIEEAQLSAVLVTDELDTLGEVLDCLRRQTLRERIELVVVAPSGVAVDLDAPELRGFAGVRRVEVDSLAPISAARAAGVRMASAPLVFVGETHAFPADDFGEAVAEAHQRDVGAVVPVIEIANPVSALGWANHLLNYGPWIAPGEPRDVGRAPAYLTTYKRELLGPHDADLDVLFDAGAGLDDRLRAAGHRVVLEPTALVSHAHVSKLRSWLADRYLGSRVYAAARARRWSRFHRVVYCAGAPLMPFVYVGRTLITTGWWGRRRGLPRGTVAAVVAGALVSTLGEVAGCAAGAEKAHRQVLDLELHRLKHLAG
jgi:hypothetical protein